MRTLKAASGDLFISESTGRFKLIENEEKLSQDIAEALLTGFEAARNFGNRLINFVSFIPGVVPNELADAVSRLRKYQERQQDMPAEEKISSVNAIDVVQVETELYYFIEVSNDNKLGFGKLLDKGILTDLSHLLPAEVDWYSASSG
jgi:hypothetical protein